MGNQVVLAVGFAGILQLPQQHFNIVRTGEKHVGIQLVGQKHFGLVLIGAPQHAAETHRECKHAISGEIRVKSQIHRRDILLVVQFCELQLVAANGKLGQAALYSHAGNLPQLVRVALVQLYHQFLDVSPGSGDELVGNQIDIRLE